MTASKKRLSISLNEQTRTVFDHVTKQHALSDSEQTLELLLKTYREVADLRQKLATDHLALSENEEDLLNEALSRSGLTRSELIKKAVLNEIKAINKKTNLVETREKGEDVQTSKKDGTTLARINIAVTKIKTHNDNQTEKSKKFFIGETAVYKLTGSNRTCIKEYMALYKGKIDDHNNKHEQTNKDNLKPRGYDIKTVIDKIDEFNVEG